MAQITVNKEGLVSLGFLSGIYTFVHDNDPECHHFDNQSAIHLSREQEDHIVFTKKYAYNKLITTLQHEIRKTDRGFVWEITRNVLVNELHYCRFGITMPLGTFLIEDKNGLIPTQLINYQQYWEQKYPDQTNIDLPILKLKRPEPVIVCTSLVNSVQFFKFQENDTEYLKVSAKNGTEVNLTIHLMPDKEYDLEQTYCSIFPESEDHVYQAELLKRKIRLKYNVRVLSHEAFHQEGCTACPPTKEELEPYMELLEENLSFYPAEVFECINLKTISVCGYLANDSELIKGRSEIGGMLLNASAKLNYVSKCRAIHHEMYHMIEWSLSAQKQKELELEWKYLPKDDLFTEHFKEIRAITHPVEYRCELFATFVLDPRFVQLLADKDTIVRQKLRIVKSIFGGIGTFCNTIVHNHDQNAENTLIRIFEAEPEPENKPVEILERLLVGVKHSCLPELLSVTTEFTDTLIVDDASQVPTESDIAYVTISPLDFCAMEYMEQHVSVEDSFARWIAIHTSLESSRSVLRLRSEDILTFNTHIIEKFLEGVGIPFEVHHLWDVTREIRPYHLDSIPFLKQIWSLFRKTPIVTRVGYSNISYEE